MELVSSENGRPVFSVVLPTHNRPSLMQEAVDSVIGQRFRDWELLVVDDASLPRAAPAISQSPDQCRLLRHPVSLGGAAAKNSGVRGARGEVIAFLDDDDLYDPGFLEQAYGVLRKYPEIDVLFIGVAWFGPTARWGAQAYEEGMERTLADAGGRTLEDGLVLFDTGLLTALLNRVPMAFQRPVMRRKAFELIGPYRTDCLLWDSEWALRAAMKAKCALLQCQLYRQRCEGQGYSSKVSNLGAHTESALRMVLGLLGESEGSMPALQQELLRLSAARKAGNLAYFHAQRGNVRKCVSAWRLAGNLDPATRNWKLPVSAILRAFRLMKRVP